MWPFKKVLSGLFHKPRYRIMESGVHPGRYFIWDRNERTRKGPYFKNLDEVLFYVENNNLDCDQYRMFK